MSGFDFSSLVCQMLTLWNSVYVAKTDGKSAVPWFDILLTDIRWAFLIHVCFVEHRQLIREQSNV